MDPELPGRQQRPPDRPWSGALVPTWVCVCPGRRVEGSGGFGRPIGPSVAHAREARQPLGLQCVRLLFHSHFPTKLWREKKRGGKQALSILCSKRLGVRGVPLVLSSWDRATVAARLTGCLVVPLPFAPPPPPPQIL